jgi:outer membrane protein OmpA-like peptidoglycan-associated protein
LSRPASNVTDWVVPGLSAQTPSGFKGQFKLFSRFAKISQINKPMRTQIMKKHLLIYKSILLLACSCYTSNGFAADEYQVKLYDQIPSERQLLEDLMPSSEEIQLTSSSVTDPAEAQVKYYDQMPTRAQLLEDLKPSSEEKITPVYVRSVSPLTGTCRDPDFKAKSVAISIKFAVNSSMLTKDTRKVADLLGDVLSADVLRDCDFEIEGHTDSSGSVAYNKKLSKKRAKTVTNYLVNRHSINPARIKAIGYGENRLLLGISSTSSKQRRVQVKNVGSFR